jgi:heme A synthase
LVGIASLALLVQAFRRHRHEPYLLYPAIFGFVLYILQSALGAITVWLSNEWVSVLLHLGNSMFLLACFVIAWLNTRRSSIVNRVNMAGQRPSVTVPEIIVAAILAFAVAMIGAAVAGNAATKACTTYPLCGGEIWPVDAGPLQMLNMAHRIAAGALGLMLVYLLYRARSGNPVLRTVILSASGIYLAQAALGAGVVLINVPQWLLLVFQSLHVTFAAATWSVMILASGVVWLQQQSSLNAVTRSEAIRASSATTSN